VPYRRFRNPRRAAPCGAVRASLCARTAALACVLACGLALALAAGCGLKTPPRPLSEVLPPPAGVRAWQREAMLQVAWQLPDAAQQERYRGVRAFDVRVRARPLLCVECPLKLSLERRVALQDEALERQGGWVFLELPWPAEAGRAAVEVRTRFGLGLGPPSASVVVEAAGPIPAPALAWRWAGAATGPGARSVQFYWEPARERVVQSIGPDGQPRERVQTYRVNLYRRVAPAAWPALPINGEPIPGAERTVPPLQAEFPPDASGEAFRARFVDQFGNEGPPSPEVVIPLEARRP